MACRGGFHQDTCHPRIILINPPPPNSQANIQHYKPSDVAISMSFADRPVTTQNISISNSLSLLGQCKNPKRAIEHRRNLEAI